MYDHVEVKLETLKADIKTTLGNGFVQLSSLPMAAPILFAKMKDGSLPLFFGSPALNRAMLNY